MQSRDQVALELLECERVTLFLVLRSKRELRGRMGDEAADEVISVRFGEGIAGRVALTGEAGVAGAFWGEGGWAGAVWLGQLGRWRKRGGCRRLQHSAARGACGSLQAISRL
jgi:hypothetical protein